MGAFSARSIPMTAAPPTLATARPMIFGHKSPGDWSVERAGAFTIHPLRRAPRTMRPAALKAKPRIVASPRGGVMKSASAMERRNAALGKAVGAECPGGR